MSWSNRSSALFLALCVASFTGCSSESNGQGGPGGSGGDAGAGGQGGAGGEGGAGGTPPLDTTFKAATCVRDITPVSEGLAAAYEEAFGETPTVNHTDPIYMAGFGTREATGYNDKLWARGMVFAGPGGRVAIVSIDLIGYFVNETATIRAMLAPESAIDHAVISSSHQHEGPDTLGLWGPNSVVTGIDHRQPSRAWRSQTNRCR